MSFHRNAKLTGGPLRARFGDRGREDTEAGCGLLQRVAGNGAPRAGGTAGSRRARKPARACPACWIGRADRTARRGSWRPS
jgi:hypothetical protein